MLCGGIGTLALAGCTGATPVNSGTANPGNSLPVPDSSLNVISFGAVGDGRTDDTAAVVRALTALRTGQVLSFPSGHTFCHSGVLSIDTDGVRLTGGGTLQATQEATSALRIRGHHVTLDDLTLATPNTTRRWGAPDQHRLLLDGCTGALVSDVSIVSSAAAGVFCRASSDFVLRRVHVSDTRADGIHLTGGSFGAVIESPILENTGDDGVAVVSYAADGATCHDISVHSPVVRGTSGGRGLSVVGGSRVSYTDIDVERTFAAGVYIACEEGDFVTAATSDVEVRGGRVTGANTSSTVDHGAVLVYSGRAGSTVSDVTVSDLVISGTRASASRQIGVVADSPDDGTARIDFRDLTLATTPTPYQGNAPTSGIQLQDVTAGARAVTVAR